MIKLVAFDWNGTLLSDATATCHAANQVFKDYGKKAISVKKFRQTSCVPVINFYVSNGFNKKFTLNHAKEISTKFISYYEPRASNCRSRSGAKNILNWLDKNKFSAIIFSNHTLSGIKSQLKRLKLGQYIDTILAHDTSHHHNMHERGKGDRLITFIREQGYSKAEVLVIGDTDEEIEIGKKYGFHTVGITEGHQATHRITKHHPDFLIHNMLELKKIVQKLNA